MMLLAILIVGIIGRELFSAFYLVRELLVVVSFAAVAVFFIAGLVVIAVVLYSVWQGLVRHVKSTNAFAVLRERLGTSLSRPLISRGVYERESRFKA
jgi:hypothetical protein